MPMLDMIFLTENGLAGIKGPLPARWPLCVRRILLCMKGYPDSYASGTLSRQTIKASLENIMGAIKRSWISETALMQFQKDHEQADTRRQIAKVRAEMLAQACGLRVESADT
jgi:hypothetical protein